jgi:hypothetical protein
LKFTTQKASRDDRKIENLTKDEADAIILERGEPMEKKRILEARAKEMQKRGIGNTFGRR